ncbi:hypothetical protein B484DRAFT_448442 [Ochromonadaceae sp. CCMP2298]|nr:hypothetical protein B484DRAFT_448442 [Ochromonadaceae sp. CCMP2298]|mmetsp:Transcript_26719/g.59156  ORF Transcript_26719/g.59156 Transcript_26719/m.59156 type:complete len:394 (-) Transcript_26719:1494-2675(-)|eukprot:CAMPEP_0173274546 /NCGR_PEP_ID=MMETSP1143-20121109/2500_1 /TAXON_ID=483371 /ORGANISM="non described non described, Strain CCMP2298" /LENGTH=393 /DNA_ID=CAMNT_0014211369 /DNA_START=179 /DNA_END=1360 /DNA_ORIENTATION=+
MQWWDLPTDYFSSLLSTWLSTAELGRLDSALCNKQGREIYLSVVSSPRFCTYGDSSKEIEDLALLWHIRRRVRLRSMVLGPNPDLNLRDEDSVIFNSLELLDVFYRVRFETIFAACCSSLRILRLGGTEVDLEAGLCAALSCPLLESLSILPLHKAIGGKKAVKSMLYKWGTLFASQPPLLHLHTLSCTHGDTSPRYLKKLLQVGPNITTVVLKDVSMEISLVQMLTLKHPHITCLRLHACPIPPESFKLLPSLRHLICLDLNGCPNLAEESVVPIIQQNPSLREINLRHGRKLPSAVVMKIASNCPLLTSLDIAYCTSVKDDGMLLLALKCPDLQDLQLCGCEFITDEAMVKLANCCPKLTSINIKDCVNITKFSCQAFEFMGVKPYRKKLL